MSSALADEWFDFIAAMVRPPDPSTTLNSSMLALVDYTSPTAIGGISSYFESPRVTLTALPISSSSFLASKKGSQISAGARKVVMSRNNDAILKIIKSRTSARRHREVSKERLYTAHLHLDELDIRNDLLKEVIRETTAELQRIKQMLIELVTSE